MSRFTVLLMTYSQKLRDPRWQKKRLEIFTRDNWKCLCCGSTAKNLQVHHVVYRKIDPWAYPDYLYQTLCEDCHEARHAVIERIVDSIRIAIKDIPAQRLAKSSQALCDAAMLEIEVGQ